MILMILVCTLLEPIAYLIPAQTAKRTYSYYLHFVIGRLMLFILGFYSIPHSGNDQLNSVSGKILISNHSSWIDILYFWTFYSPIFVSGSDGRFCRESAMENLSRIFNVNLAKGDISLDKIIKEAESMQCPIVIFPEGSTTNGRALLKFNVFTDPLPQNTTLFGLLYSKADFSPSYSVGSGFKHFYNLSCQLENKLLVKRSVFQNGKDDVNANVLKGLSSLTRQRITNLTSKDKLDFYNFFISKKK